MAHTVYSTLQLDYYRSAVPPNKGHLPDLGRWLRPIDGHKWEVWVCNHINILMVFLETNNENLQNKIENKFWN